MISIYYDPLALINLIEKKVLAQTDEQYPFVIIYNQEPYLYGFQKNNMKNDQCYKKFNTKVDVGNIIRIIRQHEVLLKWNSQQVHNKEFAALQDSKKNKLGQTSKRGI